MLGKRKQRCLAFTISQPGTGRILPTTNPIESTFATVRLRTQRTKGCGSRVADLDDGLQTWSGSPEALAPVFLGGDLPDGRDLLCFRKRKDRYLVHCITCFKSTATRQTGSGSGCRTKTAVQTSETLH
jgi:hypothetical protein